MINTIDFINLISWSLSDKIKIQDLSTVNICPRRVYHIFPSGIRQTMRNKIEEGWVEKLREKPSWLGGWGHWASQRCCKIDLVYLNLFSSNLCISRNLYWQKYASRIARQESINYLSPILIPIKWDLSGRVDISILGDSFSDCLESQTYDIILTHKS